MNLDDMLGSVPPGAVAVHEYLRAQTLFLLMYSYTTRPNVYIFFATIAILLFYESSKLGLYAFLLLAAVAAPISCYFLSRSYLILNMLTYFPYENNQQDWQVMIGFTLPWLLFIGSYTLQFFHQRRYNYMTPIGRFVTALRNIQMARMP